MDWPLGRLTPISEKWRASRLSPSPDLGVTYLVGISGIKKAAVVSPAASSFETIDSLYDTSWYKRLPSSRLLDFSFNPIFLLTTALRNPRTL